MTIGIHVKSHDHHRNPHHSVPILQTGKSRLAEDIWVFGFQDSMHCPLLYTGPLSSPELRRLLDQMPTDTSERSQDSPAQGHPPPGLRDPKGQLGRPTL